MLVLSYACSSEALLYFLLALVKHLLWGEISPGCCYLYPKAANSQPAELMGLRNLPIFVSAACDSEESYLMFYLTWIWPLSY